MAADSKWIHKKCFAFWLHEEQPDTKLAWYSVLWKNRFTRLFFIELGIIASTALVLSWQPFSSMLMGSQVYGWLCTAEERESYERSLDEDPDARYRMICATQEDSINMLYNLYYAAQFLMGALAGICLDFVGPVVTGCIGQLLLLLGCLGMILATSQLSLYIPAIIFLGGSANFIVFPSLALPDYFPGREGLIISLNIACQNGGGIVTTLLDTIFRAVPGLTLNTLFAGYLILFLVPVGVCYILSLPLIRLVLNPLYVVPQEELEAFGESDRYPEDIQVPHDEVKKSKTQGTTATRVTLSVLPPRKWQEDVKTPEFCGFALFTLISTLQYNYYPVVLRKISGDDVARFNGYIFPTQAVWGVIYGMIVDHTTTIPILYFLVSLIAAVYVFCLIPSQGLQYLTTSLYVLGTAYIYSVKFTYAAEIFSPRTNGVLIGALSIVGGLVMLGNLLLVRFGNIQIILILMLAIVAVSLGLVVFLHYRRRKGINYKGCPSAPDSASIEKKSIARESTDICTAPAKLPLEDV